jgi:hypothetical protein
MSQFNTEIIYAKGSENRVVDCLSYYYEKEEGDTTSNEEIDWANVDVHLDPEGNVLPHDRWLELRAGTIEGEPSPQKSKHLVEKQETSIIEAQEMASVTESITEEAPHTLWRRIQQFLNLPGHYENLSWNTGIDLGFLMLSAGGIRMSHYLQK